MMMAQLLPIYKEERKDIDKVITDLQNINRIQIDFISEKDLPVDYYEKDFYILY